jgi:hypothetical protein
MFKFKTNTKPKKWAVSINCVTRPTPRGEWVVSTSHDADFLRDDVGSHRHLLSTKVIGMFRFVDIFGEDFTVLSCMSCTLITESMLLFLVSLLISSPLIIILLVCKFGWTAVRLKYRLAFPLLGVAMIQLSLNTLRIISSRQHINVMSQTHLHINTSSVSNTSTHHRQHINTYLKSTLFQEAQHRYSGWDRQGSNMHNQLLHLPCPSRFQVLGFFALQ